MRSEPQLIEHIFNLIDDHATDTGELDQSKVGRLSRMDAMQSQEMAKAGQRQRLTANPIAELCIGCAEQADNL